MIPSIATSRRCRGRENITNGTTRRARPMPTCTARRRACMISCAPTTITRARTGKTTSRIRCKSWTAGEIAKLPTYYVMDLAKDMAATVAEEMPSAAEIAANKWLPDSELAFYSAEYARTGFQGGLQWYRCGTSGAFMPELQTWSGRTIDVPSAFISGKQDWGTYQRPGVYRGDADESLHQHDRLPSRRWRRPLGAAGAAGRSEPACWCNSCRRRRQGRRRRRPGTCPTIDRGGAQY